VYECVLNVNELSKNFSKCVEKVCLKCTKYKQNVHNMSKWKVGNVDKHYKAILDNVKFLIFHTGCPAKHVNWDT